MSILRNDFIKAITDLINNSMLPPFVIEPILKDIYSEICLVTKQQLENDIKYYSEQLNPSENIQ